MRKKAKRKPPPKPNSLKAETDAKGKRKPQTASTAKDKKDLIQIWDEDLCE